MSHQALARRWRPRDFPSLVGQAAVVTALTHALTTQRLHHAYLLTGTRGVGKTTIARILAKALNCERGVSALPCGQCAACTGIDAGRYVDYIEMDAASNRGVDEMTQVLEQAIYAPSAGRYKVYVIDEVHMLTNHAFNAMLKTLEEPPAHVIFVLATTDPQKVPVTVLSRCLQFNLRNMTPQAIVDHLKFILAQEEIEFDDPGLQAIARAARGSMRDALSLLDQAIAFGGGKVQANHVRDMLGVVAAADLTHIVDALLAGDAPNLVKLADDIVASNVSAQSLLHDLAALFQRIAVVQAGVFYDNDEAVQLAKFATALRPEDLQVYYQIALYGARDLPYAVDAGSGLTMTLLRLLAFAPVTGGQPSLAQVTPKRLPEPQAGAEPAGAMLAPATAVRPAKSSAAPAITAPNIEFDGNWPALSARLGLTGMAQQFMQQSELVARDESSFNVRVPIKALAEPAILAKVRDALGAYLGRPVRLSAQVGAVIGTTAAVMANQAHADRVADAQQSIQADPFVQTLIRDFGGKVIPDSVRPID
jgi:DNA polymerase III subunit gamma/tau